MDSEYLTTREVAELLRIKERKVYDMAADQQIPCTRATGKLLFSRSAITQWLASHSSGNESVGQQLQKVFAGSHDPLLEWAIRESQCGIPVMFDGSVDGVERVVDRSASVCAMHIYSPLSRQWNVEAIEQRVSSEPLVLVNWVVRQRGLVVKPGLAIKSFKDIVKHKVALRQSGAGSQLLFQHFSKEASIEAGEISVALTARSEADLASAIASGEAECGLGLESLAKLHKLEFIPMIEESFDLLVHQRFWFEPSMQKFIEFCSGDVFRDKVLESVGYRSDSLFKVVCIFPNSN